MKGKVRRRLIERQRRKQNKHYDWRRHAYYLGLNCYAISRALNKSRACQHQLGIYAIRPALGMRYNYGYTFSMFREDIRRRIKFWKLALSKKTISLEVLQLIKYVNFIEKQELEWKKKFFSYNKITLKMKGYEGFTIYQPVFPIDIEHKEFLRKQPKNRFKGYFKRRRKAERLKKAGKKNWQSFEPKESEL